MLDRLPFQSPTPLLTGFNVLCVAGLLAVLVCRLAVLHRRREPIPTILVHAIFGLYLVALVSVVLLPLHGVRAAIDSYQGTDPLARAWNWGLQLSLPWSDSHLLLQRVANVALTVPLGFGVGLFAPTRRLRHLIIICVGLALTLELAQLTISVYLGFVYRTFDIDDIIDNTVGGLLGLATFAGFAFALERGRAPSDEGPSGFVAGAAHAFVLAHRPPRNPPVPPIERQSSSRLR